MKQRKHKIALFLVDDHAIVRDGIKMMLSFDDEFEILGEFDNSKSLFESLKKISPDLILLDITLPGLNGIEITKIINQTYPSIKILILSALTDERSITDSIKAGANGFLSKDIKKDELKQAILAVAENKRYVGSSIAETVFQGFLQNVSGIASAVNDSNLTDREVEIIRLFSDGLLYKQIAHELDISVKTVESHKSNIMKKLEIKSTVELVKYAIKNGLVQI